jgi:hypothetical protein
MWRDLAELLRHRRADPRSAAVGAFEVRKARLDGEVALLQRVIIRVREMTGASSPVIAPVVLGDLGGQPLQFGAASASLSASIQLSQQV